MVQGQTSTIGQYLAARLQQIGIEQYFTVPGDYNLVLLDELLKNEQLEMISCCNELNAGYAADGYARATGGAAAVVVTYSVGGLSLLNAVAGAYAEDLPVIAISGGPNTNSTADHEYLHHTLGVIDYRYQCEIFKRVTADAVIIHHPAEAPAQIDRAIEKALRHRKPVYLEIACNVPAQTVSAPNARSFDGIPGSNPKSLRSAVDHAAGLLKSAVKPVLVAGPKIRPFAAEAAFGELAEASGYAYANMPNAKGFVDENHAGYIGTYWASAGSPGCDEIIQSTDLAVFAGPTLTDYTTTGHSALINPSKIIMARPGQVIMPDQTYTDVTIGDFLSALAKKVTPNDASLVAFNRVREEVVPHKAASKDEPTNTRLLFARIQELVSAESAVIAETGDSWFNCMRLNLPTGARFEIQMQYGSIGWSVGAALGYALGDRSRRVIACIGDGSFQLTAQEVSTMVRYGVNPIIFLINNGGYTIEVEIHDGPYNTIKNWDYAALMGAFNADDGNGWSAQARTAGELDAAIETALGHDGPSLIEVAIDRDDCSKELLEWGGHVAKNNGRPPNMM